MRTLIAVFALVGAAGRMRGEAVAQADRPLVFSRICNIERGQDDAALALARDMVDLADKK